MKRLYFVIALLCIAFLTCFGQARYPAPARSTTIKNLVDNCEYGTFRVRGAFVETYDEESLLFTVEDQEYVIPIRLVKKDLGAVKRFRALNLQKGDTLVIEGRLHEFDYSDLYFTGYKGLVEARIIEEEKNVLKTSDKGVDVVESDGDVATQDSVPFQIIEVKPSFNGGDANEFSKWVNSHLRYPKIAKENGVQGRVTLQFTIKADGRLTNVRVLNGVDESLDKEAVRVVSSSPKWKPGESKGKPVDVTYTFPVIFQFNE